MMGLNAAIISAKIELDDRQAALWAAGRTGHNRNEVDRLEGRKGRSQTCLLLGHLGRSNE